MGRPIGWLLAMGLLFCAADGAAEGIAWRDLTIDEALAEAAAGGTFVMIDVYASHCGQCKEMDVDLWDTPEGAELGDGLIAMRIPSDRREGIELQQRYPILGLPAVLFLAPDGTELDRIIGFRDRGVFLEEARLLKAGADPLPDMEREVAEDPKKISLLYDVFEKYLYRKRLEDAKALLPRLEAADPQGRSMISTKAIMMLAKYHDYFLRDRKQGQVYWRRILEHYPESSGVTSALKATIEYAKMTGTLDEWITWVCQFTEAHPKARSLNMYTARFAHREGLRRACLAKAARNAMAVGRVPAGFDTVATQLEER